MELAKKFEYSYAEKFTGYKPLKLEHRWRRNSFYWLLWVINSNLWVIMDNNIMNWLRMALSP